MGSGKHLSETTITAILKAYHAGQTGPQIADTFGISWSTVVKLLRRKLGPVGTDTRNRRKPIPTNAYDEKTRNYVIELHKQGLYASKISEIVGCSTATVIRIVKNHGLQPQATGAPRRVTPKYHCRVCGELIKAAHCYHGPNGVIVPARTCNKPECKAALAFGAVQSEAPIPRRDVRTSGGWTPRAREGAKKREALEEAFLAERLPQDIAALAKILPVEELEVYEARFQLFADTRGARRPENQASLWGELSRVPVYVRLVARGEAHSAITLVLRRGESVFDRFVDKFFTSKEQLFTVSKAFNPLLAWRCACSRQTTWILPTVADLPEETGFHGLCPVCKSCALHVQKEER